MRVNFMGVVGPQGLLPIYYTELVIDRLRAKDATLRDFLDIFHHRIISLFYRVWQKYRFQVAYEQGDGDQFSQYLLALIGLGMPALQHRQEIPTTTFPLLRRPPRPTAPQRPRLGTNIAGLFWRSRQG